MDRLARLPLFFCMVVLAGFAPVDGIAQSGHGLAACQIDKPASRQWQDEVIYVVIVQKFCNGNPANDVMRQRFGGQRQRYEGGFWGGDLEGIIQKLDYLSSLGATALLLYPVMANDRGPFGKYLATGYRPRDYFHVDENFGDLAILKRLVDLAHQRRMRVILDLPLGIPGVEHPYYRDPGKRQWFGPLTRYGIRQWNAEKPEVASYLIEVSRFWKEQSGCDGFRLDSAQMHSPRFWQEYTRALRPPSAKEDFFLLAELPLPPRQIGEFLRGTGLPSAYDFSIGYARDVLERGPAWDCSRSHWARGNGIIPRRRSCVHRSTPTRTPNS